MSNPGRRPAPPARPQRSRRVLAVALLCAGLAACTDESVGPPPVDRGPSWPMYMHDTSRTGFQPDEPSIDATTAAGLIPRWRLLTGAIVTAQPVVGEVELAGGRARVVYVTSWDGHVYAVRADDGSIVWTYAVKPQPGADYAFAGSGAIGDLDGRRVLYVPAGMTMYCLDAATGALVWSFDAGDGCTTCDRLAERNQIESSPLVHDGLVYFGMDVNEKRDEKGGVFAVDARTGVLRWYFDLETVSTCRPFESDEVRRFDGYHSAAELGLPADFFATRPGCDFDRTGHGCGGVWSSFALDAGRGLIYADSANCDDYALGAPDTPGVMPPYGEAIFALGLDGTPSWRWQPRLVDDRDLDFGATPNLFEATIGGERREVVGVGGKDGTYHVLDRDGVNEITGRVEPYWQTNVVYGGPQGGIIGSPAVGDGRVFFNTAAGYDIADPQRPIMHALGQDDGAIAWQVADTPPSFSPVSVIPGVVFHGSIGDRLLTRATADGRLLASPSVGGSLASAPSIVDGTVFVGAGTGERGGSPEGVSYIVSWQPQPINAFCVSGTTGCPASGRCNDANDCTIDTPGAAGACSSSPAPDGTACRIGVNVGTCAAGRCTFENYDCENTNACVQATATATGCERKSRPTGTPCTSAGRPGSCRGGLCIPDA